MEHPLTILFVDDEPAIRESVAKLLTMRGFRVLTAENGYEAMRIIAQYPVDVLFTDAAMVELAKEAKLLCPKLRVMFAIGAEPAPEALVGQLGPQAFADQSGGSLPVR